MASGWKKKNSKNEMCMYPVRRNNGKLNPTLPDRQVGYDI